MATFERFCEMKGLKLPASISGENTALGNVLSIAPQVFDESPLPNFTAQMDKPLQAFEPPMFSGDSNPCSWLEACVRYFRVSKVPANEMVDEAGWYLENKAYFWFLDWENGRLPIPWDEFSQAISCRFASLTPNPITETLAMEPGIFCAMLSYSSTGHICVDKASSKLFPIHSSLLHTNSHLKREGSTPHTLCVAFSPDGINSWALKIKEMTTMLMGLQMNASSKGSNESLEGSIASGPLILQCLIEQGGTLVWSTRNCELLYPSYYSSIVHFHGLSNHCGFKEPYKDIELAYLLDTSFGSGYTAGLRKDMATDVIFSTTVDMANINLVHGAENSTRPTRIEEIFLGAHMEINKSQNQVRWTRKKVHFPHYKSLVQPSSITELKAYTSFHLIHCTLLVNDLVIEAGGKSVVTLRMGCDWLYIRCSMKVCFSCSANSLGRGNYFDFKEPYKDSQKLFNASLSKKEFALSYLSDLQSRLLEGCNVMAIIEFVFKVPCHGSISFSHISSFDHVMRWSVSSHLGHTHHLIDESLESSIVPQFVFSSSFIEMLHVKANVVCCFCLDIGLGTSRISRGREGCRYDWDVTKGLRAYWS
ncbi:hypothetical protein LINPERHAP2_LOCUS29185 [Linum perenne]